MKLALEKKIDYAMLAEQSKKEGITKNAVCGVVFRGDQMLLIKRVETDSFRGGFWEVPGGKVEPGENFRDALIREIKEETNLGVAKIEEYIGSVDYSVKGIPVRLFMFVVHPDDSKVKLSAREHKEYLWVSREEAKRYLAPEEFTDLFLMYSESLRGK